MTLAPAPRGERLLGDAAARLLEAIRSYDEDAVHAIFDESLEAFGMETVLRELVLPTLTQIGAEWETDNLGIAREHFGSNLIRGRLLSLARLWGRGSGPLALLACVPGEAHDISLIAFGLALRSHGWRILFLGADTPMTTLAHTASTMRPALVVLTSFDPALLEAERRAIRRLAKTVSLVLSGPGATPDLCKALSLRRLNGDLVAAAGEVARGS